MSIFKNPLAKLNLATALHGLAGGFFITHVSLILNKNSILLAATFNAIYALGSALSKVPRRIKQSNVNKLTLLLRILIFLLASLASSHWFLTLILLLALILASMSRRQFIDLKQEVGGLDVKTLTGHGSFNAIGYGIGAALSALFLNTQSLLYALALLFFILSFIFYPVSSEIKIINKSLGLSKRDVAVAVLFTASIAPLGNAVCLLVFSKIYGDKIAGLTVFAYTLGSLLSQLVADKIREKGRPIAKSVFTTSLFLLISLLVHQEILLITLRFLTGSLLYAAQGLLEERTHKNTESERGLDYLWSIFSLTSFTLLLILPTLGERFGFIYLPVYSIALSLLIASLKKIMP